MKDQTPAAATEAPADLKNSSNTQSKNNKNQPVQHEQILYENFVEETNPPPQEVLLTTHQEDTEELTDTDILSVFNTELISTREPRAKSANVANNRLPPIPNLKNYETIEKQPRHPIDSLTSDAKPHSQGEQPSSEPTTCEISVTNHHQTEAQAPPPPPPATTPLCEVGKIADQTTSAPSFAPPTKPNQQPDAALVVTVPLSSDNTGYTGGFSEQPDTPTPPVAVYAYATENRYANFRLLLERAAEETCGTQHAWIRHDIALLDSFWPDATNSAVDALENARNAQLALPHSRAVARTYHLVARQAQAWPDVILALASEAQCSNVSHSATLLLERAHILAERMDAPNKAKQAFEHLATGPKKLEAALGILDLAVADHDWASAADAATQAADAATSPQFRAELYGCSARHAAKADDFRRTGEAIERCLATAPLTATTAATLERVASRSNQLHKLVDVRKWLLSGEPDNQIPIQLDLALLARYRLNDNELAQNAFEQVAQHASDSIKKFALSELIELQEATASWQALAENIESLIDLTHATDRKVALLTQLGDVLSAHQKDPTRAIVFYQKALAYQPDHRRALEGARRLYRQRGDTAALVAMYRAQLTISSDDERRKEPAYRLGELLIESTDAVEEGIDLLFEVLPDERYHNIVFRCLARALHQHQQWPKLLELLEKEADRHTGSQRNDLLERSATIAEEHLNDRFRAVTLLRKIKDSDQPSPPKHIATLRRLLRIENDWRGLSTLLEETDIRYRAIIYDRHALLADFAEAQEKFGDIAGAATTHQTACELSEEHHNAVTNAAQFLLDRKKYDELAALYQQTAGKTTSESKASWLTQAADIFERFLNKRKEAIDLLRRAVSLGDPQATPNLLRLLAVEGLWKEYNEISSTSPDTTDSTAEEIIRRGAIAEAIGNTREALDLYLLCCEQNKIDLAVSVSRLQVEEHAWQSVCKLGPDASPHYRLLAAEIARDELNDSQRASELFQSLAGNQNVLALSLWELERTTAPRVKATVLADAEAWNLEENEQAHFQRILANQWDESAQDNALELRTKILQQNGWCPVVSTQVELALLSQNRWHSLVEILQLNEAFVDADDCTAVLASRLGFVYERLQQPTDAHQAWQRAMTTNDCQSMAAIVGLASTAELLGDPLAHQRALLTASERIPVPWIQATCHWLRAGLLMTEDKDDDARVAYFKALEIYPAHRPSLLSLAQLLETHDESELLIPPLTKAFENAASDDFLPIGRCLITHLMGDGKLDTALNIAEKLHEHAPQNIPNCMLLCELNLRLKKIRRAAELSMALSQRDDVVLDVRSGAAVRYAKLANQLSDHDDTRDWLDKLQQKQADSNDDLWVHRHDLVEIYLQCKRLQDAADLLAPLVNESKGQRRDYYASKLAHLYEQLEQPENALDCLSQVTTHKDPNQFVDRILALISASQSHSDETGPGIRALTSALASPPHASDHSLDHDREITCRRWLETALESENDPAAAIANLERILVLCPDDIPCLEKLATLATELDPALAVPYQAALLTKQPYRTELYRDIRTLYVESGDIDGSFLVEGVLTGLGQTSEEESYFYRQRRSQLGEGVAPTGDFSIMDVLAPPIDMRLQIVLKELQAIADVVLPADWTSYGLDTARLPGPGLLNSDFQDVASWLGVSDYRLVSVQMEIAPTLEQSSQPVLLVPSSLANKSKRHRQCIAAALLSRVHFHGILGTPSSLCAVSGKQLGYLVRGAIALAHKTPVNEGDAIFRDLYKRLDLAMSPEARSQIATATKGIEIEEDCGSTMILAMNDSSAKAALLFARDPAVAIECFRAYPQLFGDSSDSTPSESAMRCLAFTVSNTHRDLRDQLKLGVQYG